MTTGAKVGLAIGGVAILGIAAYFIFRGKGGSTDAEIAATKARIDALRNQANNQQGGLTPQQQKQLADLILKKNNN
jgi:hypothetical protein